MMTLTDISTVAEGTLDLMGNTWTCDIHSVDVEIGAGDCPLCMNEIGVPDYIPDWVEIT